MAKKKSQSKKKSPKAKTLKAKPARQTVTVEKMTPRRFIRFVPDVGAMAYILTDKAGLKLKTPLPCLVIEESYGGCSLVAVQDALFHKDAEFEVQVGKLSPMKARVRWARIYDGKVSYFGVEYLV